MATRTAYFLDIDNLAGAGRASQAQISNVLSAFEAECHIGASDLVFCAATTEAAFYVKQARPGYTVAIGKGKDGADRRLLDLADIDMLKRQFTKVVVGSGDAIFRPLIAELSKAGLEVELITGRGRLSQHLYRAVAPKAPKMRSPIIRLKIAA